SAIDVSVEHDRGPFNGRAEVSGTAMDQWGGALEAALVEVRDVASGRVRTVRANADGQFTVVSLPAGEYQVQVTAETKNVSRKIKLEPRDRAVLTAVLQQESNGVVVQANNVTRNIVLAKAQNINGAFGGIAAGLPAGARFEAFDAVRA